MDDPEHDAMCDDMDDASSSVGAAATQDIPQASPQERHISLTLAALRIAVKT